ncbi:MAG: F0F1 ATP synthase subunit epsilon [Bacillota bacterium]
MGIRDLGTVPAVTPAFGGTEGLSPCLQEPLQTINHIRQAVNDQLLTHFYGGEEMASTFQIEIVTPDRKLYEGEAEMVIVRTTEGDLAILKNHMSLVSPLAVGGIRIKNKGEYKEAACAGGFVQVRQDKTTIITDSAEWPEEIDVERARKAAERAEERLKSKESSEVDIIRAQIALDRALNRLRIAKRD